MEQLYQLRFSPPGETHHDAHAREISASAPKSLRHYKDTDSTMFVQRSEANSGPTQPLPPLACRSRAARRRPKASTPIDVRPCDEIASTQGGPGHGQEAAIEAVGESSKFPRSFVPLPLREVLNSLAHVASDRICLIRKAFYLGPSAAAMLHAHFGAFGIVKSVLIPRSHTKYAGGAQAMRPASLAVIVMADALAVDRALQVGCRQYVAGRLVLVERYERRLQPREESCGGSSVGSSHGSGRSSPSSHQSVSVADSSGTCIDAEETFTVSTSFEYWATDEEVGFSS